MPTPNTFLHLVAGGASRPAGLARAADLALALAMLALTLPLALLLAAALRLRGGPLLARRVCLAGDGGLFTLLTFRVPPGPLGTFMRLVWLDQLPLLLNLLRGDLTLRGPCPSPALPGLRPRAADARAARPGVSGWLGAQMIAIGQPGE